MKKIVLLILFCNLFAFAQNKNIQLKNKVYRFGVMPNNIQNSDLAKLYFQWKYDFIDTNCTDGRIRVKFDNPSFTVSEGIAYGMLLAAYANDDELFEGLWRYYESHTNANGVMHWKIKGCDTVIGKDGVTGADLDVAIALIIGGNRFGNTVEVNYHNEAKKLIQIIKNSEIEKNSYVIKPGDTRGGSDLTSISYFIPSYFRVFGEFTNDIEFWDKVIAKGYDILNANLLVNNATDCLVSDWTKADGSYSEHASWAFNSGKSFYYDAGRVPWRITLDFLWYGKKEASDYLDKCRDFIDRIGGVTKVTAGYHQDGKPIHSFKDPVFTGAFSVALMSSNATDVVNKAYTTTKKLTSNQYLSSTLRGLYMFTLSGNFYNPVHDVPQRNRTKSSKNKVIVYPNPTSKEIRLINFKLGNKVKIYDRLGKEILTTNVKSSSIETIDVSQLPSGVYFINSNGVKIKFVKK